MLAFALTLSVFPSGSLKADAAGNRYEFESGTITFSGENRAEIAALKGASGGKTVNLRDGGNKVSLTVNADEAGAHRITVRYSQPYDEAGKRHLR